MASGEYLYRSVVATAARSLTPDSQSGALISPVIATCIFLHYRKLKLRCAFDVIGNFRAVIARANEVPPRKYVCPQTEAQEYGWITQPLVCIVSIFTSH